jgi:hypothetical protein
MRNVIQPSYKCISIYFQGTDARYFVAKFVSLSKRVACRNSIVIFATALFSCFNGICASTIINKSLFALAVLLRLSRD